MAISFDFYKIGKNEMKTISLKLRDMRTLNKLHIYVYCICNKDLFFFRPDNPASRKPDPDMLPNIPRKFAFLNYSF